MNPRSNVKQALANLSGKPVADISMQRLAPMFASQVLKRREAELQAEREAEDFVHPSFVDALRAKTAKLLDAEAENTASGLPVSSVYDALQITKRHKQAKTDAGIRALNGMLTTMWKASREGDIDAEAFMKYREYFGANFPKSAVADVFEEIGAQGYAALPVSDLLVIASRIYSQTDYDYEVQCAGLTTKQPHHVKARRFILAVINEDEETERPFDGDDPERGSGHGMDVADWLVQRQQDEAQGGDFDEWRKKNPAPKRAKNTDTYLGVAGGDVDWIEYGGLLLFEGSYGPYIYAVRPWGLDTGEIDDISDPDMTWLVYQVQLDSYEYDEASGKLVDEYGHNPWFDKHIESIASSTGEDPQDFIDRITSDNPDDLARAYEMIGGYGGWDEFDDQHYWDAEQMRDIFSDILEPGDFEFEDEAEEEFGNNGEPLVSLEDQVDAADYRGRDARQAQDTQMLSWNDEYAISEEELEELGQWHSSTGDPIYQLSSHLMGGHDVPLEVGEAALQELEKSWMIVQHEGREDENQDLAGLIDSLHYWIKPY